MAVFTPCFAMEPCASLSRYSNIGATQHTKGVPAMLPARDEEVWGLSIAAKTFLRAYFSIRRPIASGSTALSAEKNLKPQYVAIMLVGRARCWAWGKVDPPDHYPLGAGPERVAVRAG
eukprot:402528-Prorocentrum_minimum.AAC.1